MYTHTHTHTYTYIHIYNIYNIYIYINTYIHIYNIYSSFYCEPNAVRYADVCKHTPRYYFQQGVLQLVGQIFKHRQISGHMKVHVIISGFAHADWLLIQQISTNNKCSHNKQISRNNKYSHNKQKIHIHWQITNKTSFNPT